MLTQRRTSTMLVAAIIGWLRPWLATDAFRSKVGDNSFARTRGAGMLTQHLAQLSDRERVHIQQQPLVEIALSMGYNVDDLLEWWKASVALESWDSPSISSYAQLEEADTKEHDVEAGEESDTDQLTKGEILAAWRSALLNHEVAQDAFKPENPLRQISGSEAIAMHVLNDQATANADITASFLEANGGGPGSSESSVASDGNETTKSTRRLVGHRIVKSTSRSFKNVVKSTRRTLSGVRTPREWCKHKLYSEISRTEKSLLDLEEVLDAHLDVQWEGLAYTTRMEGFKKTWKKFVAFLSLDTGNCGAEHIEELSKEMQEAQSEAAKMVDAADDLEQARALEKSLSVLKQEIERETGTNSEGLISSHKEAVAAVTEAKEKVDQGAKPEEIQQSLANGRKAACTHVFKRTMFAALNVINWLLEIVKSIVSEVCSLAMKMVAMAPHISIKGLAGNAFGTTRGVEEVVDFTQREIGLWHYSGFTIGSSTTGVSGGGYAMVGWKGEAVNMTIGDAYWGEFIGRSAGVDVAIPFLPAKLGLNVPMATSAVQDPRGTGGYVSVADAVSTVGIGYSAAAVESFAPFLPAFDTSFAYYKYQGGVCFRSWSDFVQGLWNLRRNKLLKGSTGLIFMPMIETLIMVINRFGYAWKKPEDFQCSWMSDWFGEENQLVRDTVTLSKLYARQLAKARYIEVLLKKIIRLREDLQSAHRSLKSKYKELDMSHEVGNSATRLYMSTQYQSLKQALRKRLPCKKQICSGGTLCDLFSSYPGKARKCSVRTALRVWSENPSEPSLLKEWEAFLTGTKQQEADHLLRETLACGPLLDETLCSPNDMDSCKHALITIWKSERGQFTPYQKKMDRATETLARLNAEKEQLQKKMDALQKDITAYKAEHEMMDRIVLEDGFPRVPEPVSEI